MIQPVASYNLATRRRSFTNSASPFKGESRQPDRSVEATACFSEVFDEAMQAVATLMLTFTPTPSTVLGELLLEEELCIKQLVKTNTPRRRGRPKLQVSPGRTNHSTSNGVMKLQDYIYELGMPDETQTIYNQLRQQSREIFFSESHVFIEEGERRIKETCHRRCESTNNTGLLLPVDINNPFFFSLRNSIQTDSPNTNISVNPDSPQFMASSRMSSDTTLYKHGQENTNAYWPSIPNAVEEDYPSLAKFMKLPLDDHECSQYPLRARVELGDLTNLL